ncbi:MAG: DNA alkylation repair protein [Alphaproteobacteria bacterium]|nr:DNA alkylation repair protein [Alphaproteobacteria bacterium]
MTEKINILQELRVLQDKKYKDFNSALIPNISKDLFIGVRTPKLRKLAKEIIKSGFDKNFISKLPHKYFEENQLHAFILSEIKDFNVLIKEIERFLPYVDNWATCDQMNSKIFRKNTDALYEYICKWIKSKHVYSVRFAIKNLMQYWLGDKFDVKYADMVVNVKSDDYYVNMMRAWYFATAAAKNFDEILPYFKNGILDDWTRLQAIKKACESYRVSDKNKEILRSFR